jgi:hypothetical protein
VARYGSKIEQNWFSPVREARKHGVECAQYPGVVLDARVIDRRSG